MKKDIVLVGGGGHCKACIDVIEAESKFRIVGIVDKKEKLHQEVLGYRVIASDEDLPMLLERYEYFLITIGQISSGDKRKKKFEYLENLGAKFPVVVSPSAYVSETAFVDNGTIIMHKAFINASANIGKDCIINTGVIIEHDVKIASHCHISTGAVINGECSIGERTFVGSNSVTVNSITIARNTIVGAGSSVIVSIHDSGTYVGSPVRKLGKDE